ncbi:MAG: hypothetical protein J7M38_04580 [Armatimonadetes bacterium]|nr:hypothetical protein [Armatimonadota bacterium]
MKSAGYLTALMLLVACAAAWAGLELSVGGEYLYQTGDTSAGRLTAQIDGLEMGGGLPVAATGSLQVDLTLEVLEVSDEGVARVRMSFADMQSEFMGEKQAPETPQPIEFAIDPLGRPMALEDAQAGEVDLLASGGIPLQLLGMLTGVVELPQEPVGFGEEWGGSTQASVPGVGDVALATQSRLTRIEGDTATVASSVRAQLPEMTTANPMGQGQVTIRQGVLVMDNLERTVDLQTGFVSAAEGAMTLTCMADLGGMGEMPLKVMGSFSFAPPASEQQAAAPEPHRQAPAEAARPRLARTLLAQLQDMLQQAMRLWEAQ